MILKYHMAEEKLDGENEHLSMATGQVLRSKDLWLKLGEELDEYDLYASMQTDLHAYFDPQGMLIFRKRQNSATLDVIVDGLMESGVQVSEAKHSSKEQ